MPRKPHSAIVDRLRLDLSSLVRESTEIRERCAATAQPKYYMSLYALLMGAFSQVDLFAALCAGTLGRGQAERMRKFLQDFTAHEEDAIAHAVQLYRHTLMHTGRPRKLLEENTGRRRCYLLHWGRKGEDEASHFTINEAGTLTLNLECLLEDLVSAFERFAAEVDAKHAIANKVEAIWPDVELQKIPDTKQSNAG
ncbi:MAG: hypothetical protein ABI604_10075 [Nitrospirota bacterium]